MRDDEQLVKEYIKESLTELRASRNSYAHPHPRILSFLQSPRNFVINAIKRALGFNRQNKSSGVGYGHASNQASLKNMSPEQKSRVKLIKQLANSARDAFLRGDKAEAERLVKALDGLK